VGEVNYHQELTGKPRVMEPLPESERDDMSERLAAFDGTPGFDPRGSIEQMSIPGLWILGDRDGWIPARETRLFLESMVSEHDKDFTIVYDPEGGHQGRPSYLDEAVDWILAHLDAASGTQD
jgi:pimeloyl-ACP methyl ester carboxylesterase